MRIAITTQGATLDSPLDPRFGRAAGFIIYDLTADAFDYLDNATNMGLGQGAGIQAAQGVVAAGAKALVTGHVGPKAFLALQRGGVDMYLSGAGTVREAVEAFKAGTLTRAGAPDKDGHW